MQLGRKRSNILWEQFKTAFDRNSKILAPTRHGKVRSEYAPWLNAQIKKAMNNRDEKVKKKLRKKLLKLNPTNITKHKRQIEIM